MHTKFIAIKRDIPGIVYQQAENLESLKRKLTSVGEFDIFELVYTDTVEYAHTVVEVR